MKSVRNPEARPARPGLESEEPWDGPFYWGRALFRAFFWAGCRWEVQGREYVPAEGGFILAPNHTSYADPPLAGSALARPVWFMAKRELFSVPLLKHILPSVHAFPVARGTADRRALRRAYALLTQGKVVVIFPEGGRSPDGRLMPAEPGIALVALRAGVPVVPMGLMGADRVLPRSSPFPRPAKVRVRIGEPLRFDHLRGQALTRELLQAVAADIGRALAALLPAHMGGLGGCI